MKYISQLFAILYLSFNLGIGINMHYCMGFLKGVSIGHETSKCCCGKSKLMSECCDNEHFELQMDDEQVYSSSESIALSQDIPIISREMTESFIDEVISAINIPIGIPPPKLSDSRIYINSLILYA